MKELAFQARDIIKKKKNKEVELIPIMHSTFLTVVSQNIRNEKQKFNRDKQEKVHLVKRFERNEPEEQLRGQGDRVTCVATVLIEMDVLKPLRNK